MPVLACKVSSVNEAKQENGNSGADLHAWNDSYEEEIQQHAKCEHSHAVQNPAIVSWSLRSMDKTIVQAKNRQSDQGCGQAPEYAGKIQ
jgi:hypothetical protein